MRIVANAFALSVLPAGSAAGAWQELFNRRGFDNIRINKLDLP